MRRHLLVTNDFPPKLGGIQSYLWELWQRLDPKTFSVLTANSDPRAKEFDAACQDRGISVVRVPRRILFFPTRSILRQVEREVARINADLVIWDPAFPLGLLASRLSVPSVQVLHGAEVSIPGRLPFTKRYLTRALNSSAGLITAGPYPAAEAYRLCGSKETLLLPPGVDTRRFIPVSGERRRAVRAAFDIAPDAELVVSVNRLVPRKGMDSLIKAASLLKSEHPNLEVVIGGKGRDAKRLQRLIANLGAPVRLVGRIDDDALPSLIGSADLMVMPCRNRWFGLEQEGFGIVYLEAASCAVPQIAGNSGGAGDAVVEEKTGIVLKKPRDPEELAQVIADLLSNPRLRESMGRLGRERAVASFDYDVLAHRLGSALEAGWPMSSADS